MYYLYAKNVIINEYFYKYNDAYIYNISEEYRHPSDQRCRIIAIFNNNNRYCWIYYWEI